MTTAWVERTYIGARGFEFDLSMLERLLIAGRALCFYAGRLLWPTDLSFIYPRWQIDPAAAWQYVFPLFVLGVFAGLWMIRNRTRGPLAAGLLFAGTLFPALGFFDVFPFRYSFVADHFQYLASIPRIVLFSAGSTVAVARARVRAPHVGQWSRPAALALLAVLGFMTWQQSRQYVNNETLYRTTLARNPGCWLCHNNLAAMRLLESPPRLDAALVHLQAGLRSISGTPKR